MKNIKKKKTMNKNKQHKGFLEYYKKIHRGLTEANKKGQNIWRNNGTGR